MYASPAPHIFGPRRAAAVDANDAALYSVDSNRRWHVNG
jgi:hypothetical protein